jgi:hypothetical protein
VTFLLIAIAVVILLFGFVVVFGAPYVPSLRKEVRDAFKELYPLGKDDVVVDLGSGDGLVLVEASKKGATGIGIEMNPLLVLISKLRLGRRAKIRLGDMWQTSLPKNVSLVYAFTVSRDTKRLERFMQSEADRLQKEITLMTFGAKLPIRTPIRIRKAHSLYSFKPLQAD